MSAEHTETVEMAATTASDVAAAPTNAPEKLEAELAAPVNEPVHKTDEVAGADEEQGLSWTKEEEKGVLRKVDLAIVPFMLWLYILSQIDRSNLANAYIMNAETPEWTMAYQLGLNPNGYNIAVSVFFIGYVLAELPSNLLLTKLKPSVQIARICITWGLCATLMGATFNFASLIACRIFLGVFEGGLGPGIVFILGFWYRKHERASRWALIYSGSGIAGSISGVIGFAVANMNGAGGLAGWRWLFILEGLPTVITGFACYWLLPDYPQTTKMLTDRQRDIAIARLPPNAPSHANLHFNKAEIIDAVKTVQIWIFCLAFFSLITVLYSQQYFIPRIIASLGFKSYDAQLLSVGLQMTGALYNIFINFVSDKTKERGWLIFISMLPPILGWILMATVQQNLTNWQNYGILYLTMTATGTVPLMSTYAVQNVQGATKAATVSAVVLMAGNAGGAAGGQIYQPYMAPLFKAGHTVNAVLLSITALSILTVKFINRFYPQHAVEANVVHE